MIDITPSPVLIQLGTVSVYWYGIAYAVGLAAAAWVMTRQARRLGLDADLLPNGMIVVAIAAVIGGRLYHVIDQWQLYEGDLSKIVLPPYTGLGAYGGIIVGTIVGILYARRKRQPVAAWADVVAPGLFAMQAVARWGNFFNQELYGPPTSLPWGIAIECQNRIPAYPCEQFPFAATHFHPLFLYESISGLLGLLALLYVGRRFAALLRPGDLLLVFFVWYGLVRFGLETFRANNWVFFGIPTAQLVSFTLVMGALAMLSLRHRPSARQGTEGYPRPTGRPRLTWRRRLKT